LPSSPETILRYLEDAIAAEKAFEDQLRSFANEGDDEEVQFLFADHADETRAQRERLKAHLASLGAGEEEGRTALPSLLDFAPKFAQAGHTMEERLVQNLVAAFSIESGESAMYEALAHVARAAGDRVTELLAREMQEEERRAAEKLFHFLPTRSKIAFNVLTAEEIDPSVETKVGIGS
jgi:ferritin-like metal-binding protein YciE